MNNIIHRIQHTARAAAVLLLALLAAQTAWAEEDIPEVSDADGLEEAFYDQGVSVINVTDDITNVGYLYLNHYLTIYLNGHTISGDELYFDVGPYVSLTINGEGEFGSVGNITSGYADGPAINNEGTVTLRDVNITTNYAYAIDNGTLNIGNYVSFNGWTGMPFRTPNVNIIEGGNYSANVVATVTVGGTPHYFENLGAALAYIDNNADKVDLSWSESDDTYTIHTAAGWDAFCDMLEAGETFSGKTIVLAGDIGTPEDPVNRMGSSTTQFQGTFDGAGHTLTVQYGTPSEPVNQQFVAPFPKVAGGATFRSLTIAGSIYSGYATNGDKGTGGLIGCLFGGVTVEHCVSTVTVNAASDRAGGFVGHCEHAVTFTDCVSSAIVTCTGSGSGFVGWSRASDKNYTIAFYGCLFDGKVLKQGTVGSGNGSFVGWKGFTKTVTIINCIAAPDADANMATDNSATFCRHSADTTLDNGETRITNCYYTAAFDIAQGKACHSITAGENVTIEAIALTGDATQYTVSGITAYSGGGLQRGETLYYGIDDNVSLTLSNTATGAPEGYQYDGYTASAGTLSGTTLTMPDENVTISVNTAALRSTGQPVSVSYVDASGQPASHDAIALDGTETTLNAGWYFVGTGINYSGTIYCNGNVNIILADGKTMVIQNNSNEYGISASGGSLNIYGQAKGTGTLEVSCISACIHAYGHITISGGKVIATRNGENAIFSSGTITINGGSVTTIQGQYSISGANIIINGGSVNVPSYSNGYGIYAHGGSITINGGTVNATGIMSNGTITISGGRVTATGGSGIYTDSGTITLGCTTASDFIYVSRYVVGPGGSLNIADGQTLFDEYGKSYSGNDVTIPDGKTLRLYGIALTDNGDNSTIIANNNGKTLTVALQGRTLYKDGKWNTLCLPFGMSELEGTPLEGAKLMTLDVTEKNGFDTTEGTMYLSFKEATAIEAGVPYLVKWDKAEGYDANPSAYDIANPVFNGVTISSTAAQTVAAATDGMEAVQMVGTYSPVSVTAGDKSIMFLGTNNTLYYTTKGRDILSCRAYFAVPYIKGNAAAKVSAFTLNFNNEVTGITTTNFTNFANEAGAWYTLDGRKLSGKPTKKGMYINNGKKIVIE